MREKENLNPKDMNIREFYLEMYPTDDLGLEINTQATFPGLLNQLIVDGDIYLYLGVVDSLVRERCFEKLADELNVSYDYVYDLWMNENPIRKNVIRKNVAFNLN